MKTMILRFGLAGYGLKETYDFNAVLCAFKNNNSPYLFLDLLLGVFAD